MASVGIADLTTVRASRALLRHIPDEVADFPTTQRLFLARAAHAPSTNFLSSSALVKAKLAELGEKFLLAPQRARVANWCDVRHALAMLKGPGEGMGGGDPC